MDVENSFHMTGGHGRTSYAKNSYFQRKASEMMKHITMEAIKKVYNEISPKSIKIADLGCSSGPNTLSIIQDIVEGVEGMMIPELCFFLNDLPTNDFNAVFQALPEFYKKKLNCKKKNGGSHPFVFIAGYPGSFYERIFPNNSLHFVYSSLSLHWLSQIPAGIYDATGRSINKGNIYISKTSPEIVTKAYYNQFHNDFSLFLRLRSEEVVSGGRMVLILFGRIGADHVDRGNSFYWDLLARSLQHLVSQEKVEKEKFDSYDVHFYAPSKDEIEDEVKRQGSFTLDQIELFEIDKDQKDYNNLVGKSYGEDVSMTVRAIQESMISNHFGEEILDSLFDYYGKLIDEEVAIQEIQPITFLLLLRKL